MLTMKHATRPSPTTGFSERNPATAGDPGARFDGTTQLAASALPGVRARRELLRVEHQTQFGLPRTHLAGDEMKSQDVVDLAAYRRRQVYCQGAIDEAQRLLQEAQQTITDAATVLALAGPWRDWEEAQPVGAMVEISPQALQETDDSTITRLVELASCIEEARNALGKGGRR